jgi:hypothetical protein
MKYLRIRFRNLGRERAVGQYSHGDRHMDVDPRQPPREMLDTIIHEGVHAAFRELPEDAVIRVAGFLTETLWRAGYRRVELGETKHRRTA